MKLIKQFKRKLAVKMLTANRNRSIFQMLDKVNLLLFHWNDRRRYVKYGKEDKDKTYYVIRPRSSSEGLLSLYFFVVRNIKWADENGYISYVDFSDRNCQYYTGMEVNGTKNAWEYYFEQPCGLSREELEHKHRVLLSGYSFRNMVRPIGKSIDIVSDPKLREIYKRIPVKKYIRNLADALYQDRFSNKTTLGILIRGTDYVALKPPAHPIQPSLDMVISKVDEYLQNYAIDQIFVVTEDRAYFEAIKSRYKEMVFSSDSNFVEYNDVSYVSDALKGDPYQNGLNYLIRLILLSKCEFLVAGITNGSLFSLCIQEGTYESSYLFNLGLYE